MNEIKHICMRLTDMLMEELDEPRKADTVEVGAVVDMIKDLMDAEKNDAEADYYFHIVEAMEGATPAEIRSMFR